MRYGRYTQLVLCQSLCSACLQKRMSELIRNALGPVRAIPNPTKAPFAREEPLASNTVRQCSKWNSLLCRKPKWPSSLNRCYGSFWAGSGQTAFGSINPQSGTSASAPLRDTLPTLRRSKAARSGLIRPRWSVSRYWEQHKTAYWH